VGRVDTGHRALCHALFDAIEREDLDGMARCYAPGMTLWFNVTGQEVSGDDTIAAQAAGRELQRRRTYDDRIVNTFDDGFVVQYTLTIVLHDGSRRSLWACTVAEVHDGRIVKLSEYLDSGRFGVPKRARATAP
jgi:ketosteroid isomerase-like protein